MLLSALQNYLIGNNTPRTHTAHECPGGTGNETTYSGGEGRTKAKFKAW